ncbi:aminoacyl-tRNA hydrolase [Sphingobacterium sp. SGG-5]|uniref:alternative ribosome rescue aminoacyl-tRNA hydrolase ArfB n=1 Tax=Sphingobacterium sp. SGG-5 TaxID=2710881 RepID=UPI0013EC58E7|nr:alternative ribosome rescue aminoacyl-tRNA hydrolase ArfB [Sphingobacterium sp. SGG-5]NGM63353.1 aminoacyl-tRNA hydrolase [Sphingobacterium sp. SGG-5]
MIDRDILLKELMFKTSRSSGAGGQHVNKVESKVTLLWDVQESALLSGEEKNRLVQKLANRIQANGYLQMESSETRSQLKNKEIVLQRLVDLIEQALIPAKKRIPTKIPRSKVLERLDRKKKQAAKKNDRRWRME